MTFSIQALQVRRMEKKQKAEEIEILPKGIEAMKAASSSK